MQCLAVIKGKLRDVFRCHSPFPFQNARNVWKEKYVPGVPVIALGAISVVVSIR